MTSTCEYITNDSRIINNAPPFLNSTPGPKQPDPNDKNTFDADSVHDELHPDLKKTSTHDDDIFGYTLYNAKSIESQLDILYMEDEEPGVNGNVPKEGQCEAFVFDAGHNSSIPGSNNFLDSATTPSMNEVIDSMRLDDPETTSYSYEQIVGVKKSAPDELYKFLLFNSPLNTRWPGATPQTIPAPPFPPKTSKNKVDYTAFSNYDILIFAYAISLITPITNLQICTALNSLFGLPDQLGIPVATATAGEAAVIPPLGLSAPLVLSFTKRSDIEKKNILQLISIVNINFLWICTMRYTNQTFMDGLHDLQRELVLKLMNIRFIEMEIIEKAKSKSNTKQPLFQLGQYKESQFPLPPDLKSPQNYINTDANRQLYTNYFTTMLLKYYKIDEKFISGTTPPPLPTLFDAKTDTYQFYTSQSYCARKIIDLKPSSKVKDRSEDSLENNNIDKEDSMSNGIDELINNIEAPIAPVPPAAPGLGYPLDTDSQIIMYRILKFQGDTTHVVISHIISQAYQKLNNLATSFKFDGNTFVVGIPNVKSPLTKILTGERPLFIRAILEQVNIKAENFKIFNKYFDIGTIKFIKHEANKCSFITFVINNYKSNLINKLVITPLPAAPTADISTIHNLSTSINATYNDLISKFQNKIEHTTNESISFFIEKEAIEKIENEAKKALLHINLVPSSSEIKYCLSVIDLFIKVINVVKFILEYKKKRIDTPASIPSFTPIQTAIAGVTASVGALAPLVPVIPSGSYTIVNSILSEIKDPGGGVLNINSALATGLCAILASASLSLAASCKLDLTDIGHVKYIELSYLATKEIEKSLKLGILKSDNSNIETSTLFTEIDKIGASFASIPFTLDTSISNEIIKLNFLNNPDMKIKSYENYSILDYIEDLDRVDKNKCEEYITKNIFNDLKIKFCEQINIFDFSQYCSHFYTMFNLFKQYPGFKENIDYFTSSFGIIDIIKLLDKNTKSANTKRNEIRGRFNLLSSFYNNFYCVFKNVNNPAAPIHELLNNDKLSEIISISNDNKCSQNTASILINLSLYKEFYEHVKTQINRLIDFMNPLIDSFYKNLTDINIFTFKDNRFNVPCKTDVVYSNKKIYSSPYNDESFIESDFIRTYKQLDSGTDVDKKTFKLFVETTSSFINLLYGENKKKFDTALVGSPEAILKQNMENIRFITLEKIIQVVYNFSTIGNKFTNLLKGGKVPLNNAIECISLFQSSLEILDSIKYIGGGGFAPPHPPPLTDDYPDDLRIGGAAGKENGKLGYYFPELPISGSGIRTSIFKNNVNIFNYPNLLCKDFSIGEFDYTINFLIYILKEYIKLSGLNKDSEFLEKKHFKVDKKKLFEMKDLSDTSNVKKCVNIPASTTVDEDIVIVNITDQNTALAVPIPPVKPVILTSILSKWVNTRKLFILFNPNIFNNTKTVSFYKSTFFYKPHPIGYAIGSEERIYNYILGYLLNSIVQTPYYVPNLTYNALTIKYKVNNGVDIGGVAKGSFFGGSKNSNKNSNKKKMKIKIKLKSLKNIKYGGAATNGKTNESDTIIHEITKQYDIILQLGPKDKKTKKEKLNVLFDFIIANIDKISDNSFQKRGLRNIYKLSDIQNITIRDRILLEFYRYYKSKYEPKKDISQDRDRPIYSNKDIQFDVQIDIQTDDQLKAISEQGHEVGIIDFEDRKNNLFQENIDFTELQKNEIIQDLIKLCESGELDGKLRKEVYISINILIRDKLQPRILDHLPKLINEQDKTDLKEINDMIVQEIKQVEIVEEKETKETIQIHMGITIRDIINQLNQTLDKDKALLNGIIEKITDSQHLEKFLFNKNIAIPNLLDMTYEMFSTKIIEINNEIFYCEKVKALINTNPCLEHTGFIEKFNATQTYEEIFELFCEIYKSNKSTRSSNYEKKISELMKIDTEKKTIKTNINIDKYYLEKVKRLITIEPCSEHTGFIERFNATQTYEEIFELFCEIYKSNKSIRSSNYEKKILELIEIDKELLQIEKKIKIFIDTKINILKKILISTSSINFDAIEIDDQKIDDKFKIHYKNILLSDIYKPISNN